MILVVNVVTLRSSAVLKCICLSYAAAAKSLIVMSNSVRPRRRQPTRLPHPWDSPGKNIGVGCHFLLQWKWKVKVKSLSHVWLFATPWIVAYQAPQSMEFSRQEYWSGLPFPSPGDLPYPGIEPGSPALWADTLTSEPKVEETNLSMLSIIAKW